MTTQCHKPEDCDLNFYCFGQEYKYIKQICPICVTHINFSSAISIFSNIYLYCTKTPEPHVLFLSCTTKGFCELSFIQKTKNRKMYSSQVHIFSRCILCIFIYLYDMNVDLSQPQTNFFHSFVLLILCQKCKLKICNVEQHTNLLLKKLILSNR